MRASARRLLPLILLGIIATGPASSAPTIGSGVEWISPGAGEGLLTQPLPSRLPSRRVQLPILNHIGDNDVGVETWIKVQNVGTTFTKAALVLWGEPGQCAPQA
ncbi:MAG: hypothetical protein ACE5MB_06495, partial [Anaerolineae bacterium]